MINSEAWTGRSPHAETPIQWLLGEIHAALWPSFDCEDCISMIEHGCYCAAMEAVAPCQAPGAIRRGLRAIFTRVTG